MITLALTSERMCFRVAHEAVTMASRATMVAIMCCMANLVYTLNSVQTIVALACHFLRRVARASATIGPVQNLGSDAVCAVMIGQR